MNHREHTSVEHLSVAEVRELLGDDGIGMTDEQLMEIRVRTEELAALLLEQFAAGARAPQDFVSKFDRTIGVHSTAREEISGHA